MSCLEFFLNFGMGWVRFGAIHGDVQTYFCSSEFFGIWGWMGFGVVHGTLEDALKE